MGKMYFPGEYENSRYSYNTPSDRGDTSDDDWGFDEWCWCILLGLALTIILILITD